jgi:hypothetical protein
MTIDYEKALNNLVRTDGDKAVQMLLSSDEDVIFSIFPQALNPVLKAMESLGKWESMVIVPYHDDKNKPIYIIAKVDYLNTDTIKSKSLSVSDII